MGLFWGGLSPFLWSVTCLLLRRFVFRIESSAKREWMVAKRNRPWEGRRRDAKRHFAPFLLPIFLCVQIFIRRERRLGTRQGCCRVAGESSPKFAPEHSHSAFRYNTSSKIRAFTSCLWTFKKNCACFTLHTNRRGPFQSLLISDQISTLWYFYVNEDLLCQSDLTFFWKIVNVWIFWFGSKDGCHNKRVAFSLLRPPVFKNFII